MIRRSAFVALGLLIAASFYARADLVTYGSAVISSLTQLPRIATGTLLGNQSGATGTPSALTATQAYNVLGPVVAPNVLMNSAMDVDQANEGASVSLATGVAKYIVDGWEAEFINGTAVVSAQRVADAPAGFTNSLKVTVGTGAAVAAGSALDIFAPIEADNITDTALGTASATGLCVSWWVKSSIGTYTYGVALQNNLATRSFPSNRTVAGAATWTQDSFCLTGDTAGAWVTSGVNTGMFLVFGVAAGSTFQGTNSAWQAANVVTGPSPTNTILSTNGATFQVTGVKLEISTVATPIKRNPFWQELAGAQRYFAKTFAPGTAPAQSAGTGTGSLCAQTSSTAAGTWGVMWQFPEIMRTSPTITTFNPAAANANIRDVTGASDVVVQVDPAAAKSATGVEIASQTTALTAAHALCIQATADARL